MPPPRKRTKRNTYFVDTKTTCFLCLSEIPPDPPPVIDLVDDEEEDDTFEVIEIEEEGNKRNDGGDDTGEKLDTNLDSLQYEHGVSRGGGDETSQVFSNKGNDVGREDEGEEDCEVICEVGIGGKKLDEGNKTKALETKKIIYKGVTSGEEGGQQKRTVCLRSVCKYLKVDPWNVLSKNMAGGSLVDLIGVKLQNTDLLVLLCDSCTCVVSKLTRLCQELEILQMEVDHSTRVFMEVLRKSDSDPALMEKFRGKLSTPLELIQASVADNIRTETRIKCQKRLDKTIPRVNLGNRTGTKSEVVSKDIPLLVPMSSGISTATSLFHKKFENKLKLMPANFKCNICGLAFASRSSVTRHKYRRHRHNYKRHEAATIPSKAPPVFEEMKEDQQTGYVISKISIPTAAVLDELMNPMPHIKTTGNHVLCSLCSSTSLTAGAPFSSEDGLRRHIFCSHPDYFFTSVKLPDVSTKDFQSLCEKLITEEISQSVQAYLANKNNPRNCVAYTCSHCKNIFLDRRAFNVHLIEGHYELLATTLVGKQVIENRKRGVHRKPRGPPSVNIDPWIQRRPNIKTKNGMWKCPDCRILFTQNSSLYRHRKHSCVARSGCEEGSDSFKSNHVKVKSSEEFKCPDCNTVFAHPTSLLRHRKQQHNYQPSYVTGLGPRSLAGSQSAQFFRCEFCGNTFAKRRYLSTHLQRTSCSKRKMEKLQSLGDADLPMASSAPALPPPVATVADSLPIVAPLPSPIVTSSPAPGVSLTSRSPRTCDFCGKTLSSSFSLGRHQRKHCVEAKAAREQNQQSSSSSAEVVMDQDYFLEEGEETMLDEGEVCAEEYISTKIEVLEMDQIHLSGVIGEETGNVKGELDGLFLDRDHQNVEYTRNHEDNQQNVGEMILPDTEDPLNF